MTNAVEMEHPAPVIFLFVPIYLIFVALKHFHFPAVMLNFVLPIPTFLTVLWFLLLLVHQARKSALVLVMAAYPLMTNAVEMEHPAPVIFLFVPIYLIFVALQHFHFPAVMLNFVLTFPTFLTVLVKLERALPIPSAPLAVSTPMRPSVPPVRITFVTAAYREEGAQVVALHLVVLTTIVVLTQVSFVNRASVCPKSDSHPYELSLSHRDLYSYL